MKFLILATCVYLALAGPVQPAGKARAVATAAKPVAVPARSPSAAASAASIAAKSTAPAAQTAAVAAVKSSSSSSKDGAAEIIHSESDVRPDGYKWSLETDNGIHGEAEGELKKFGEKSAVVSKGSYGFKNSDGTIVEIKYIADENGFQPEGDVIPTPPPMPEAIVKALQFIKEHPNLEEQNKPYNKLAHQ